MLLRHRAGCRTPVPATGPPTVWRRSRVARCEAPAGPREEPSHVWYLRQNWNRQVPIQASATSLRFAVIGAGRLGASLALALRARGQTLVGFTAGSAAGRIRGQDWLGMPGSLDLCDLVRRRADLYLLCVPDGAVPTVAAELASELSAVPRITAGLVVAHTSGATSISALRSCEEAGAAALVFHPLQTFPEPLTGSTRFAGAGVALTPGPADPDAAGTAGLRLAEILGMRPFFLADDKRSLYHAAATVACNYLVTLEHLANELFVKAGMPERVSLHLFLPLVTATIENLAAHGPADALTGPLSRGDATTVAGHLAALAAAAPEVLGVYRALGDSTLQLVETRGDLTPETVERLRALLAGPAVTPHSVDVALPTATNED